MEVTAKVRTRRLLDDGPLLGPIGGYLAQAAPHDRTLAGLELVDRGQLSRREIFAKFFTAVMFSLT